MYEDFAVGQWDILLLYRMGQKVFHTLFNFMNINTIDAR